MLRTLVLLALCATAFAGVKLHRPVIRPNTPDQTTLEGYFDQLTTEQLSVCTSLRMCEDGNITLAVTYFNSAAFDARIVTLLNEPSVQEIIAMVITEQLSITELVSFITDLLSCQTLTTTAAPADSAFAEAVTLMETMPLLDIATCVNYRALEDTDYAALINAFNTQPGLGYLQTLVASDSFLAIVSDLTAAGVDVAYLQEIIDTATGIPL